MMENGGTDRGRWSEEEEGDEREGMRLGGGRETRRQKHFYLDQTNRELETHLPPMARVLLGTKDSKLNK